MIKASANVELASIICNRFFENNFVPRRPDYTLPKPHSFITNSN